MSNLLDNNQTNDITKEFVATTFDALIIVKEQYDELLKVENKKDLDEYHQIYSLLEKAITLYSKTINPNYDIIISSFKKKYIKTESLVEKNNTKEQIEGVRNVYDYIRTTDTSNLNLLVESLKINLKLWEPTDKKNNEEIDEEKKKLKDEIFYLTNFIKSTNDTSKMLELNNKNILLDSLNYKSKIGGVLRTNNVLDDVKFQNINYKVPSANDACMFINNLSSKEKTDEFNTYFESDNLMEYIFYCIELTTNLIKYQPFMDGNKRTFRALLNLLFKARNLPPIYIKQDEVEEYKKALFKGIIVGDFDEINFFYMNKLCDSIYELDIKPYIDKKKEDFNSNIIKK